MKWTVTYYNDQVESEVFSMPRGILARYLRYVELMEKHGADLRSPHSESMGGGLFELRPKASEGIGRVLYCTVKGATIVILHSFVKKTQKTPKREIDIARRRLEEVRNG
jgi:phage-related protein